MIEGSHLLLVCLQAITQKEKREDNFLVTSFEIISKISHQNLS